MQIIRGIVESGRKLGRTLGFPTANVALDPTCGIAIGVYLSRVGVGDEWFKSVTNVGTNPTVGGNSQRSESYIFDFSGDLYGQEITIELLQQLRGEMLFDSVEQLREQISCDVEQSRQIHSTL